LGKFLIDSLVLEPLAIDADVGNVDTTTGTGASKYWKRSAKSKGSRPFRNTLMATRSRLLAAGIVIKIVDILADKDLSAVADTFAIEPNSTIISSVLI